MTLPTVALDRIAPQPWKNGGGHTRELLAWPDAAHWRLRISVAEIDRDGPFSAWPGVERWFAVVDGPGVVLTLPAGRRVLERDSSPLRFDGADAPACELIGGPTVDLNLMVRTDAGRGSLWRARPDDEWFASNAWRALYAADAMTLQIDDTDVAALRAGTLIWSDHAQRQRWRVRPADPLATRGWWLSFEAAQEGSAR